MVRVLERTAEPDSSPHPNEVSFHILRLEFITYLMILCLIPYCSSEFLPDQVSYLYEESYSGQNQLFKIYNHKNCSLVCPLSLPLTFTKNPHQSLMGLKEITFQLLIYETILSKPAFSSYLVSGPLCSLKIMRSQGMFIGVGCMY